MEADETTLRLLTEIRDLQREHLAEYRRVTQQSLEMQQRAITRHDQAARIYRRVILPVVGVLLMLLVYLLVRWAPLLFR
jgi:hypothetical protein